MPTTLSVLSALTAALAPAARASAPAAVPVSAQRGPAHGPHATVRGNVRTEVPSSSVTLSNLRLPVDARGQPLVTGEATALEHNGSYYMYFNDWGECLCDPACAAPYPAQCPARCDANRTDPMHVVVGYKTADFGVWEPLGVVYTPPAGSTGRVFRPIVVFNNATRRFVMWHERYHASPNTTYAVATSPDPAGPFELTVPSVRLHGRGRADGCGDATVLVDDDGAAYHVRYGLVVERLTDEYLAGTGHVGQLGPPGFENQLEAPVFVKAGAYYWVLAGTLCCAHSGGTDVHAFRASSPLGPYTAVGVVGHRNVTRAQASTALAVAGVHDGGEEAAAPGTHGRPGGGPPSSGRQFLWIGNQWGVTSKVSRPPRRDSDVLRFAGLRFSADGSSVEPMAWSDSVSVLAR